MATSTGFINPITGFQVAVESPWVRQQRMNQERDLAMAALANAVERARIGQATAERQSQAYEKVGLENARLQSEDRKEKEKERNAKETAAQRDERRKRILQAESRRMAKRMQDDVDAATRKYEAETKEVLTWRGYKKVPAHTPEEVSQFRAEYAAKIAKANRSILNRMPEVKVNVDDGTFEFTGDHGMADQGEIDIRQEKETVPPGEPGLPPGYLNPDGKPMNPGEEMVPADGEASAKMPPGAYGITGPVDDEGTRFFVVGDDGKEVWISRAQYFKGIGKPDPQNSEDARSKRRGQKSRSAGVDSDTGDGGGVTGDATDFGDGEPSGGPPSAIRAPAPNPSDSPESTIADILGRAASGLAIPALPIGQAMQSVIPSAESAAGILSGLLPQPSGTPPPSGDAGFDQGAPRAGSAAVVPNFPGASPGSGSTGAGVGSWLTSEEKARAVISVLGRALGQIPGIGTAAIPASMARDVLLGIAGAVRDGLSGDRTKVRAKEKSKPSRSLDTN